MKRSARILSLLLVLCMLLPGWAGAKEYKYSSTGFSLSFEAGDALPKGISELLNLITVSGDVAVRKSAFLMNGSFALGNRAGTRTSLQVLGAKNYYQIRSSLLGTRSLIFLMDSASEYGAKMLNHMGMKDMCTLMLCFPYVTESGTACLGAAIQPVLFSSGKSRSISAKSIVALAEQVSGMTESDRALRYWLNCVYAACPEIGIRLYELAESLPDAVDQLLGGKKVSVNVKKKTQTFTHGKSKLMVSSPTLLRLDLPLASHYISMELDQNAGTLSFLWKDDGATVLELTANASGVPEDAAKPFDMHLTVTVSGMDFGEEPIQLDIAASLDQEGKLQGEALRDGSFLFRVHGTLTAQGNVRLDLAKDYRDKNSISVFSLGDVSLNELISDIKGPILRGGLPLMVELPASTVAGLMDFLERGGVFDIAANSFLSDNEALELMDSLEEYFEDY